MFYRSQNEYRDAAFTLHQATERLYQCLMLTLTFYTPYNHNLVFLRSQGERLVPSLFDVWPRGARRERAMFEKLKDSYVKARYSKHFRISDEELDWLGERVVRLGDAVRAICAQHIIDLERGDGGSLR